MSHRNSLGLVVTFAVCSMLLEVVPRLPPQHTANAYAVRSLGRATSTGGGRRHSGALGVCLGIAWGIAWGIATRLFCVG